MIGLRPSSDSAPVPTLSSHGRTRFVFARDVAEPWEPQSLANDVRTDAEWLVAVAGDSTPDLDFVYEIRSAIEGSFGDSLRSAASLVDEIVLFLFDLGSGARSDESHSIECLSTVLRDEFAYGAPLGTMVFSFTRSGDASRPN